MIKRRKKYYVIISVNIAFQLRHRCPLQHRQNSSKNVGKDALVIVDGGQRGKYVPCLLVRMVLTLTNILWLFQVMGLGYALLRGEQGY
jgi:hypothetical protein